MGVSVSVWESVTGHRVINFLPYLMSVFLINYVSFQLLSEAEELSDFGVAMKDGYVQFRAMRVPANGKKYS